MSDTQSSFTDRYSISPPFLFFLSLYPCTLHMHKCNPQRNEKEHLVKKLFDLRWMMMLIWNTTHRLMKICFTWSQEKHFFVVMCSVITVLYNLITKERHQILMETLLISAWVMEFSADSKVLLVQGVRRPATVCVPGNSHLWSLYTFQHHYYP